jgi:hypothetical protein
MGLGSLLFDSMFSAGGLVLLVAQLGCLVHILKTGRPYWWIWIIWMIPVIGLAAYIYLEVRPSFRRFNMQSLLWNFKSSQERIRILEEQLEDSTTVRNRLALADELHRAGKHDQECQVVAEGLRGPFADDPQLLLRLAEAQLEAGRPQEADAIVEKIVPERSSDFLQRHKLLKARVHGTLRRDAQAEPLFRELMAAKKSEAPRYYYAVYLLAREQPKEARNILQDILYKYRRGTPVWRYQEKQWYYAAKELLKTSQTRK